MKSEIEVKFLNQDFDAVRKSLQAIGAECVQPMRLMRRAIIDYSDRRMQTKKWAFIRVRDEGDRVTLTYKQFNKLSVDGAKEIETEVKDFDETVQIFEAIGLKVQSFQESKRETWHCDDIEIMLDEWPWLQPYIEIEGNSEEEIKAFADKLGLSWEDAYFGDVMVAYRAQYPQISEAHTVGSIEKVIFGTPFPEEFNRPA